MCYFNMGAMPSNRQRELRSSGDYRYTLDPRKIDRGDKAWADVELAEGKKPRRSSTKTHFAAGRRLPEHGDQTNAGPSWPYRREDDPNNPYGYKMVERDDFNPIWWAGDDRMKYRETSAGRVPVSTAHIPIWVRGYQKGKRNERHSPQSSNRVRGTGPEKDVKKSVLAGAGDSVATKANGRTTLTQARGLGGAASKRSKEEAARRAGSALSRSTGGS